MTISSDHQVDIVDLLLEDHRAVRALLDSFDEAMTSEQREGLFRELTTAVVQHEVAEEIVVYPDLRKLGEPGEAVADLRIQEQADAEALLRSMEQLDVMSDTFTKSFEELSDALIRHAQLEESEVFPYLKRVITEEDRAQMAHRYEHAMATAPTHPHPHTPDTPPGNRILVPVAALADSIRDTFRNPRDAE